MTGEGTTRMREEGRRSLSWPGERKRAALFLLPEVRIPKFQATIRRPKGGKKKESYISLT